MSAPASQTLRDGPVVGSGGSFAGLLETVRVSVDLDLATWLSPKIVSARQISADVGAAAEAIDRLALRGGKRMRAALVVVGFACGGLGSSAGSRASDEEVARSLLQTVSRAAIAIELLQVYLLIHDDWMDDDDVRRGGPAVHVALRERLGSIRLGDAAGVLAGDLACAYAQEALLETPLPADRLLAAARAFAQIQEDVVRGQLAEMCVTDAKPGPSVELVHALKTASYTVTGPLLLGAHLAGAPASCLARLEQYGRPLGIAFQLRDDLLGTFGDPRVTGKPVGNDIRQGKRTALIASMRGDARVEALLGRVLGREDASEEAVAEVVRAMEATGARARVEARVGELLAESRGALDAMDLAESSPARAWLRGAVTALGERLS